jgi:hypothetical protein
MWGPLGEILTPTKQKSKPRVRASVVEIKEVAMSKLTQRSPDRDLNSSSSAKIRQSLETLPGWLRNERPRQPWIGGGGLPSAPFGSVTDLGLPEEPVKPKGPDA